MYNLADIDYNSPSYLELSHDIRLLFFQTLSTIQLECVAEILEVFVFHDFLQLVVEQLKGNWDTGVNFK